MGSFNYKGNTKSYNSISDNLQKTKDLYSFNNGYFGIIGKSGQKDIRQINCLDPIYESKKFYDTLTNGGIEETISNGKGLKTIMKDGSIITYRIITSTDRSPAVDINIKNSNNTGGINRQKIHFEMEKNNDYK